jgi:hypothetical protein
LAAAGAHCYAQPRRPEETPLISILEAVRGSQPAGRLVAVRAPAASVALLGEVDAAVRQSLGTRTLHDLLAQPSSLSGDGHLVK